MSKIIQQALEKYNPVKVILLFSGGHDSMCSTHYSASYLDLIGVKYTVYHGNTGIGIKETRDYVHSVVEHFKWDYFEGHPRNGETYEDIIKRWGFPGPTRQSHQMMYIRLKERALKKYVTHSCKSSVHARENVLLLSGIRQQESKIRMGYKDHTRKENSCVWSNPIFHWSEKDCERYMLENNLPRNPVKDKICISGECLCGAFAGKEELAEIKSCYPATYAEIQRLHKVAEECGHPWGWASGPQEWYKNHPPGQIDMFMCVGCENKHNYSEYTLANTAV